MTTYDHASYAGGLKYSQHFRQSLSHLLYCAWCPDTVLELGCGPGHFLKPWLRYETRMMGIDGCLMDADQLVIPTEDFKCVDLTAIDSLRPHVTEHFGHPSVDLLISLEMLEHWPVEHDSRFFALIKDLSPERVVLSVARPGQQPMPGEQHPNCQEVDEVIAKMASIDYVVNEVDSDMVRRCMLAPTALLKGRPWADFYQRNTRVYERPVF